ncbi:MAG: hypothetical protein AAGD14_13670, partial [Planctomycetota bacterium]
MAVLDGHAGEELADMGVDDGAEQREVVAVSLVGSWITRGSERGIAVLQVPRSLPRVIQLPTKGDGHDFTLLGSIIHAHVGE